METKTQIKIKTFRYTLESRGPANEFEYYFDEVVNQFLSENDIDVSDIKYSVSAGGAHGLMVTQSAMLIYKEK